jgi:hypothetical protein
MYSTNLSMARGAGRRYSRFTMKRILYLSTALLFASCAASSPPSPHGGGAAHVPGGEAPPAAEGEHAVEKRAPSRNLTVTDQSDASEVAFAIKEGEEILTDYGVSHTKEMHLILVRNDLQHFSHLHPQRDKEGVWRVTYSAPAGGTYWLYADFVDTKEEPFTIRFERRYAGDTGLQGLTKDFAREKTVEDYRITLDVAEGESDVSSAYTITDSEGKKPALEDYLGAKGHSVLISPSGDFIHTHPSTALGASASEEEAPVFKTALPSDPSFYRIFTQFQIKGKVLTVSFDWEKS